MITKDMMMRELEAYIAKCGGVYRASEKIGITPPYLYDVLKGNREISERLASHLGWKRITRTVFIRLDEEEPDAADLADKVLP